MKKIYSLILLAAALICLPGTVKAARTVLSEGFEGTLDTNGWTTENKNSDTEISSTNKFSGSKSFMFRYSTNPPQYLISKELTIPPSATDVNVSFYYCVQSNLYTESFQVGYSTTDNDVNNFTWETQVDPTNTTWEKYVSGNFPVGTKFIAIRYNANNQYRLFIDDIEVTCNVSGPAMIVYDGASVIGTDYNYSFGLANANTQKVFTLKNDGTEPTPVSVAHTGNYGVELSATSIPAGGEVTLTITLPAESGNDVITLSSSSDAIDDFVINVSGTVKDPKKLWCNFSEGLPDGWTNSSYTISTTDGGAGTSGGGYAGNTAYSDYRLYTPKVSIAEGEKIYLLVAGVGTTASWNSMAVQYSADGTTWTTAKTVSNIVNGSWTSVEVSEIPAGSYHIGFYGKYYYITDIYGGSLPAMPKNVKATGISLSGATIVWTAFNDETAWQVSYSTTSGDPANGTLVDANETSTVLTGLTTGTTYYVSVRIDNGGGDYGEWSDEISFTPECSVPTDLAASAITDETATISWTAAAEISKYQFVCVRKGVAVVWTGVEAVATTSVNLDTLVSNTEYDFYVRSYHDAETQSAVAKTSFKTDCGNVKIGWSEKFDNTSIPDCWTVTNVTNASWNIYTYADNTEAHSGYSIRFNGKSGSSATLQTPALDITEKALLKFYWKNSNALPVTSQVSSDGGNNKENIESGLSNKQTSLIQQSIDLSAYAGKTIILYFTASGNSSSSLSAFLDDITLEYKPAEVPTDLAAAETADGAVISWDNNEEGPWDLRYKETDAADWTEVNNLTQKTYTLTGLSAEKTYAVQVRANCSVNRQSAWTSSKTFSPTCPVPTAIEFSNKTYNGATVTWTAGGGESAWNLRYKNPDDADWTVVNNLTERTYNLENLTTGKEHTVQVQASCGGEDWEAEATYTPAFVAPTFTTEDVKDVTAKIEWESVEGATSYKYALVPKDDAVDWEHASPTDNAFAELSDLQALTEYDLHVKTLYASGESEAVLKQFTTIAIAPSDLTLDEVKATSVTYSWLKGGSAARQYQVAVAEGSAAADWANATLTENDVLTATIENLQPNTSYTFYVRAYYDADKVSAAVSSTFETPCAAISSFPWEEDFESVSVETIPACWDKSASTATPDEADDLWSVYSLSGGTNNVLRLANLFVKADGVAVINTPSFEIPASPLYDLTFEYAHRASCGEFAVLVSVDGGAFVNFTEPKSYGKTDESTHNSDPGKLTKAVISLADYAGHAVAFQFSATPDYNAGAIFLDNLKVAEHVNEETAIGNTGSETKAVKAIENGHLIIIREGVKYNAQGAKL